jgi:hypothetical protein
MDTNGRHSFPIIPVYQELLMVIAHSKHARTITQCSVTFAIIYSFAPDQSMLPDEIETNISPAVYVINAKTQKADERD